MDSSAVFEIPKGLTNALQEFTVSLLCEKPSNIYDFAASYFTKLSKERKKSLNDEISDSDDSENEQRYRRRKSVSAESYAPDPFEDDGISGVYHFKTEEQRKRLDASVKTSFLFNNLDEEKNAEVLDAMFERKVEPEEHVIDQGDSGDNFYVIDSGVYEVVVTLNNVAKTVATYQGSGSFGELALMYNTPRAATIIAKSEGSLWALDRTTFRRILMTASAKKRKVYEEILGSVSILKSLEKHERMSLADALETRRIKDGQAIIKQGDDADAFYFVEKGECQVVIEKNGVETEVTRLKVGDYFGELALITHSKRAASVYALGDVSIAALMCVCRGLPQTNTQFYLLTALDVAAFERLLGPCMGIMKRNSRRYEKPK
ncbi:cAMP-dependent protein kinase type II regulatory subunit [Trichoplax sp. H2]|nr:cAMP-dependent protein kinase type II regulatory subunit [Trichoplax sp. H2]|eukprot:RDD42925.1 cAMP-dependent protein kinase type II regulatory subunit [Trichoplax sp. H2]